MVSWSNDGEPVRWHSAYEWAPNIPEDAVKGFIAWSEFHKHIPRDGYSTPSAIFSPNYQNRLKIAWKSLSYLLNHELTDGETVDFLNREVRNDLWTTQSTMRGSLERADHLIHSQADSSISLNGSPSVCLDISFDAVHQLAHAIRRRVTKQLQVILD